MLFCLTQKAKALKEKSEGTAEKQHHNGFCYCQSIWEVFLEQPSM